MRAVFADSWYWFALVNPYDEGHKASVAAGGILGDTLIVTTDDVLDEFLGGIAKDAGRRATAVVMVRRILSNPNVRVLPQTRQSFLDGLDLYEKRPDKEYSLTDCISMNAMWAEDVTDVLSGDHHFEQERFRCLFAKRNDHWEVVES